MEQFVEGGILEASVLSCDFRNSDSVGRGSVGELSGVLLLVLGDFGKSLCDLAGADEGGNV